jgi:putative ABC transport system permease protein
MRLALSEMRRAKLRFGLLTGAIALLAYLIFFQQSLAGSLLGQFVGGLQHQSATVLVYDQDARRSVDGSRVRPDDVAAVGAVEGVAEAGPIGEGSFTVDLGGGELADTTIFGYQLGGPGGPTTLSSGRLPERDGEAVASAADASKGYGIDATLTVVPGGETLTVVGLASDARFNVQPTLFVSFPTYEQLVRTTNPNATFVPPNLVGVETVSGTDPVEVAAKITDSVSGVEALDRQTAVDSLPGVSSIRQSFAIILGLAFVVVILLTGFFFLIITAQKTATLTLLRAVGAGNAYLLRNLAGQVVLVIVIGLLIAIGLLAASSVALSGQEVGVQFQAGVIVTTAVAVLVLGLLAAGGSMRRILRLDPVDATTRAGGGGRA